MAGSNQQKVSSPNLTNPSEAEAATSEKTENVNGQAQQPQKKSGRTRSERDNLIFFAEKSGIANAAQLSARELKLILGF